MKHRHHTHVLLVEPDVVVAAAYTAALSAAGLSVQRVATGEAAIHAIDKRLPDVIVLEPQMARHNGVEFLYELRSYMEWTAVPVVIASFATQEWQESESLRHEFGIAAVLGKAETSAAVLSQVVAAIAASYPTAVQAAA